MKKVVLCFCFALILSLAACGNAPAESTASRAEDFESAGDSAANESAETLYERFLCGEEKAVVKNENGQEEYLSVYQLFEEHQMHGLPLEKSIKRYAFWDMNGDHLPELLIDADNFNIFTISENRIHLAYAEQMGYEQADILSNGALLAAHHSTGTAYRYTVIDQAGTPSTVAFFDAQSDAADAPYSFEDKEPITKQAFEALTEKYMKRSQDKADIQWLKRS